MKQFYTFIIALCFNGIINAQNSIPNGNFESWTSTTFDVPQNYTGSDPSTFFKCNTPLNCIKVNDPFHGTYAVKLTTAKLIPYLEKYKNEPSVILAVPRGGVPVAYPIAKKYGFPLELLMTKKIGHPSNPEFAIGAVSLEDSIVDERQNISWRYLDDEIKSIRKNLKERYKLFMGDHEPIDLKDKIVIIVDDGIATGNTILSSIDMLRKQKPKKIVVAVPVSPPDTVAKLKKEVDDFICPYTPHNFYGVGYHYVDFSEVTDREVIRLLKDINENKKAA